MHGAFKAGLVVGGAQVIVCAAFTIGSMFVCCPICPMVLSVVAGMLAGWLAVEWADTRPERAGVDGAFAGAMAAIGGLIGMSLPIIGIVLLDKVPGFQEVITLSESTGTIEEQFDQIFTIFTFVCGLTVAGMGLFGLVTIMGFVTAKYRAATRLYYGKNELAQGYPAGKEAVGG